MHSFVRKADFMKFIYSPYQLEIEIQEQQITVLTIENPKAYSEILSDLWNQIEGMEGELILSENEKVKKISKDVDLVFNPFSLDCNNRKVLTKLYQELKGITSENLLSESVEINKQILEYLEKVIVQVPYSLDYEVDFDVTNLLKIYAVRVNSLAENLLEKIVEYIKVMHRICNIQIFIFVGLKQYMTVNELKQLYEFIFYEHISMIILGPVFTKTVDGEKGWILDSDLCIIEP